VKRLPKTLANIQDSRLLVDASGSVGALKLVTGLNIVALLVPKGKRNRENKLNLNEGTILCLLDIDSFYLF